MSSSAATAGSFCSSTTTTTEGPISLIAAALVRHGTACLAWCLMDNHVHLILRPDDVDGLRAPLASAHTAFAQRINRARELSGHLF